MTWKSVICAFADPTAIAGLAAFVLLFLSMLRSYSVHGSRHFGLHAMVGSDLVLAVLGVVGVHAAAIYEKIQCLKGSNPSNLVELSVTLAEACCALTLLYLCSSSERVAHQNGKASFARVTWNLLIGVGASFLSVGVIAKELLT